MFKIIIYTNKFEKKSARLICDLGYSQIVLSWSTTFCAEVLKISVHELLSKEDQIIVVK